MEKARLEAVSAQAHAVHFTDGRVVLFSYQTPVAAYVPGLGFIRTSEHHSVTTSKHINGWLQRAAAAIVKPELIVAVLDNDAAWTRSDIAEAMDEAPRSSSDSHKMHKARVPGGEA